MSGREKRILCAGEILYDFLSATPGVGLAGSTIFEKRPGGSPFNVAMGLARQGLHRALVQLHHRAHYEQAQAGTGAVAVFGAA